MTARGLGTQESVQGRCWFEGQVGRSIVRCLVNCSAESAFDWHSPADDAANVAWARDFAAKIAPYATRADYVIACLQTSRRKESERRMGTPNTPSFGS